MHFVILYCVYVCIKSEILLDNLERYENSYLKKVIQSSTKQDDIIVYVNHYKDILHLFANVSKILVSCDSDLLEFNIQKVDVYILSFNENARNNVLNKLKQTLSWNSRAKFIILYSGVLKTIFILLTQLYIYNVLVVLDEERKGYTYFPYKYENFNAPDINIQAVNGEIKTQEVKEEIKPQEANEEISLQEENKEIKLLDEEIKPQEIKLQNDNKEIKPQKVSKEKKPEEANNKKYFPKKLPKFWRNSSLLSLNVKYQPYIICSECKTGIELEFVENILKPHIKFDLKYLESTLVWGTKQLNGYYDGALRMFLNISADIAIGHFHMRDPDNIRDFDTTISYMDDDVVWVVPAAKVLPHTTNLLHIFDTTSWIFILITMLITSLVWMLVGYMCETGFYSKIWNSLTMPSRFLFNALTGHVFKSFQGKILFVVTWLFVFKLQIIWQAYLVYFLTHDNYEHQISSLEEIVNSNMRMGITKGLARLYKQTGSIQGLKINDKFSKIDINHDIMYEIRRAAFTRDTASASTKRGLSYFIPYYFEYDNGRSMLYPLKEIIIKDYTVMFVKKGHPVFPRINEALNWARTGGFIQHLERKLAHSVAITNSRKISKIELFDTKAITFAQMQGIFILYLWGCVICTLVFIVEQLYCRKKIK